MPSSGDKRREQQRARRARASEQTCSDASATHGLPAQVPLPVPERASAVLASQQTAAVGDDMHAVARAISAADDVAARINMQFAETAAPAGMRAIAAVLHEQEHGGTFSQLAQLFAVDGASFNRDTLRKWRALVADLDKPEALVRRLEHEESRRQRNADNNAAFRAGFTTPRSLAPTSAAAVSTLSAQPRSALSIEMHTNALAPPTVSPSTPEPCGLLRNLSCESAP